MAEKVIAEVGDNSEGSVVLVLSVEEFNIFRDACLNLLDYYEMARGRARKIKKILEKLEEVKK